LVGEAEGGVKVLTLNSIAVAVSKSTSETVPFKLGGEKKGCPARQKTELTGEEVAKRQFAAKKEALL